MNSTRLTESEKHSTSADCRRDTPMQVSETEVLCDLYLEARLSRREEEALALLLTHSPRLSPKMQEVLKVMALENAMGAKAPAARSPRRWWVGVAAALLVAAMVGLFTMRRYGSVAQPLPDEGTFVVWQNGQKITGPEARKIAEEREQIDMEMLRKVMREQRKILRGTYAAMDPDELEN